MLFNADIRQNFTLKEVKFEKQKTFGKKWKYETNVYANPGLS